jgi:hypothetical protein
LSISSEATDTTIASTISTNSIYEDKIEEPYHNLRFLGCLNYYFHPGFQPIPGDGITMMLSNNNDDTGSVIAVGIYDATDATYDFWDYS